MSKKPEKPWSSYDFPMISHDFLWFPMIFLDNQKRRGQMTGCLKGKDGVGNTHCATIEACHTKKAHSEQDIAKQRIWHFESRL